MDKPLEKATKQLKITEKLTPVPKKEKDTEKRSSKADKAEAPIVKAESKNKEEVP